MLVPCCIFHAMNVAQPSPWCSASRLLFSTLSRLSTFLLRFYLNFQETWLRIGRTIYEQEPLKMNSTPSTLLSAVTSSSSTIAVSNSSFPTCLVCRSIPSSLLFSLVFGVIVLIGVCGNAFVVAVIVNDRKLLNSPVNQFLLNLAIADIGFIIFFASILYFLGHLLFCSPDMALVIIDQGWILPYVSCRILRFLQEYFLYSSVLLQVSSHCVMLFIVVVVSLLIYVVGS